jgi:hypothetical protein
LVLVLKNDEFVGRSVLDSRRILAEDTLRTMLTFIRPGSTVVEAGGRGPGPAPLDEPSCALLLTRQGCAACRLLAAG